MGDTGNITIDLRRMDEMPATQLYAMLKMRIDVFVVEQNCAFGELDGKDPDALHLRLMYGTELLACSRILPPDASGLPSIGRVVVSPAHRGKRLGDRLMEASIDACLECFPGLAIALSAQSHLSRFYRSFGFAAISEDYLEDGIPHVDMLRPAPVMARAG